MKLLSKLLYVGIASLGATVAGNAATIFTFDNVSPGDYVIIQNGYGGLGWNNFFIQNALNAGGFGNGMISSPNVAFNGLGDPAAFTSTSPLTLDSAYFTSVYASQDQLTVQGFSGGTRLYNNTYVIYHEPVTLSNFNYVGVDRILVSTSAGALFTMDNMTITVPEPATCALMSVAAALVGF